MNKPFSLFELLLVVFLAFVAALSVAPSIEASDYNLTELTITNAAGSNTSALTNVVAAASTNAAIGVIFPCAEFEDLAFMHSGKLSAAGTSGINFIFARSVGDGVFETVPGITNTITPTGTISVNSYFEINAGQARQLKWVSIENPNAGNLTNTAFRIGRKTAGP